MKLFFDKIKWIIFKISHPVVRLYWRISKPVTQGSKALLICDDEILLVKNINVTLWSLPGGKIEKNELPEVCIVRELYEELDLSLETFPYRLLGTYTSSNEGKHDTVFVFVFQLENKSFEKQWELQDAQWFPLNNLPAEISPATMRRIREFQENKYDLTGQW